MSRLVHWFVAQHLNNMGWPRSRGLLRRTYYVPTQLVDLAVEQGLQICVGLGAGRPEVGARIIADTFSNNPWTPESTASLLEMLNKGQEEVARRPDLPPWKALYEQHAMRHFGTEIEWEKLGQPEVGMIWSAISANAVFWGLSHETEVSAAFDAEKRNYEQSAPDAVRHGLEVPTQFPWASLTDFYETCEEMVTSFEAERPPLAAIPKALRDAPAIARRLG